MKEDPDSTQTLMTAIVSTRVRQQPHIVFVVVFTIVATFFCP
jgi:hypothetical protein